MVELLLPKQLTRVRFPSPAPSSVDGKFPARLWTFAVHRMRTTFIIRTVEKDVSLPSGVVKRSAIYYLQIKVPLRLPRSINRLLWVRTSLGTNDKRVAAALAHRHWSEAAEAFAAAGAKLKLCEIVPLAPALSAYIVAEAVRVFEQQHGKAFVAGLLEGPCRPCRMQVRRQRVFVREAIDALQHGLRVRDTEGEDRYLPGCPGPGQCEFAVGSQDLE